MMKSPLLVLCFLVPVAQGSSDEAAVESHISETFDGKLTFNSGSKIESAMAREQARLMTRLTRNCVDNTTYRPIDGVCTNLANPGWGAPLQTLRRMLKNHYNDGKGAPRAFGESGKPLPSARKVSVGCFKTDSNQTQDRPFSLMVMQWGQFIAHDFVGVPCFGEKNCCPAMGENGLHPDYQTNGQCFPIPIPAGDHEFTKCMEFRRSLAALKRAENCPREQINALTSYIDGGVIYGASQEELNNLRLGSKGLMKTTDGNMLPDTNVTFCLKKKGHSCKDAGDFRVNVIPGLTAMHTIWVRIHNHIAKELAKINPDWDDEKLFQESRKIVIAFLQHITYDKYLRLVVGQYVYDLYGFSGDYQYNESVNPGIYNSFAAAAFRFGHSQIAEHNRVKGGKYKKIEELYMRPFIVDDGLDDVVLGFTGDPLQKADTFVNEGVQDYFFENTSKPGVSEDLISLNIQRGRDHGLPPYVKFLKKWSEVLTDKKYFTGNPELPLCALGLYENLNEVDLYLGGLNEPPLKGASVGPTFAFIIAEQFRDIRNGDRFWYETKNSTIGFTEDQLTEIRKITLARVICDTTGISEIQPDVFKLTDNDKNKKVNCKDIPQINLNLWKE